MRSPPDRETVETAAHLALRHGVAAVEGDTHFGCCPDGSTPAGGRRPSPELPRRPSSRCVGSHRPLRSPPDRETVEAAAHLALRHGVATVEGDTHFGCWSDGSTPAGGRRPSPELPRRPSSRCVGSHRPLRSPPDRETVEAAVDLALRHGVATVEGDTYLGRCRGGTNRGSDRPPCSKLTGRPSTHHATPDRPKGIPPDHRGITGTGRPDTVVYLLHQRFRPGRDGRKARLPCSNDRVRAVAHVIPCTLATRPARQQLTPREILPPSM